jgi:hypothetical protein
MHPYAVAALLLSRAGVRGRFFTAAVPRDASSGSLSCRLRAWTPLRPSRSASETEERDGGEGQRQERCLIVVLSGRKIAGDDLREDRVESEQLANSLMYVWRALVPRLLAISTTVSRVFFSSVGRLTWATARLVQPFYYLIPTGIDTTKPEQTNN